MKTRLTLFIWLLCSSAVLGQKVPIAEVLRTDNGVFLKLGDQILEDKNVSRHLGSGLTTTFRIEVRLRALEQPAQTKVFALALRYELWEETFILTLFDGETVTIREALAGKDALSRWWQSTRLPLLDSWPGKEGSYRVKVEVIPFSAGERKAAAEWVNQSLNEGDSNGNPGSNDLGARILSTIVATSFKRRVLQTFSARGQIPQ